MRLLKGKLFIEKVDRNRVKADEDGREYIEVVVLVHDEPDETGKTGVIQQNTQHGERRIYLSNLYLLRNC